MARWLAVVAFMAMLLVACGSDQPASSPTPATPVPSAPSSPPATVEPTTPLPQPEPSPTPAPFASPSPTVTPSPTEAADRYLVYGPEGFGLWSADTGLVPWFTETPVLAAFPSIDGVFYQKYPDDAASDGCLPIWHLDEPGGESRMILDSIDGVCARLRAAGTIDGVPHIVYTRTVRQLDEEFATIEVVVLRNTRTNLETPLTEYGTFDGDLLSVSVSDTRIGVSLQGSSDQGALVFFRPDGEPAEPPFPLTADPIGVGDCWVVALSGDGSQLAYAPIWGRCATPPYELVVLDLEGGQELARVALPSDVPWPGAISVDFDGSGSRALVAPTDTRPWIISLDDSAVTVLDSVPAEVTTVRVTQDVDDCLSYGFSNGALYCAPEFGITFWPS